MRSFIASASFLARLSSRSSDSVILLDFFDFRDSWRELSLSDRDRRLRDLLRVLLDFSFFFLDSLEAERLRDRLSFFIESDRPRRRLSGVLDRDLDLRDAFRRLSGVRDRLRETECRETFRRFSGVGDRRRLFSGVGDRLRRRSGVRERLSFLIFHELLEFFVRNG